MRKNDFYERSLVFRNVTNFKIMAIVTKSAKPNDPKPMTSKGNDLLNSK